MAEEVGNEAPKYKVKIAGDEFGQGDGKGLDSMLLEDHIDMIGVAQFTFDEKDAADIFHKFKIGDPVEVSLNEGEGLIFSGFVTGFRLNFVKGPTQMTVLAMDPLCKLAASRVTKVYKDKAHSAIVSDVIGAAGLKAGTVDTTPGTHPYVFQRNESNFTFLRRLAASNGFVLMAKEGKVHFMKPQFSAAAKDIPKEKLEAMDFSLSDRNIPTTTVVKGWDYKKKEKVEGTADQGKVMALGSGDNAVKGAGQIWAGPTYISDVFVSSKEAADAMASSELNRLARGYIQGRAVIQGSGKYRVGDKVKFTGLAGGWCPEGVAISVRQVVEPKGGQKTEIRFAGNTKPV